MPDADYCHDQEPRSRSSPQFALTLCWTIGDLRENLWTAVILLPQNPVRYSEADTRQQAPSPRFDRHPPLSRSKRSYSRRLPFKLITE